MPCEKLRKREASSKRTRARTCAFENLAGFWFSCLSQELVPESVIESAIEEDEASGRAEYLGEFRREIEAYVRREAVEAVTIPGRRDLAPLKGIR